MFWGDQRPDHDQSHSQLQSLHEFIHPDLPGGLILLVVLQDEWRRGVKECNA